MEQLINKQFVAKRFRESLESYHKKAVIQERIAGVLFPKLVEIFGFNYDRILEVGAGSGFLTQQIISNLNYSELVLNDLYPVLTNSYKNVIQKPGDAEMLDFPGNYDLILSTSTFQWFENLQKSLLRFTNYLNHKGVLAFSTFGEKNLLQIKEITGKTLHYFTLAQVHDLLAKDYSVVYEDEMEFTMCFRTPYDVLKHLKQTGVNALGNFRWTRSKLSEFDMLYNSNYKCNDDCLLTYHPMFFIAIKE